MCLLWLFLWLLFILNRGPFPEKLFCGMRGAQRRSGTTRNRRKVDRVPAANFPLSAACRCASYLPSVPSVLPPETWTRVSNDRVFLLLNLRSAHIGFSSAFIRATEICHFDSDGFCLFESNFSELTSLNQLESVTEKIFLLNSARG